MQTKGMIALSSRIIVSGGGHRALARRERRNVADKQGKRHSSVYAGLADKIGDRRRAPAQRRRRRSQRSASPRGGWTIAEKKEATPPFRRRDPPAFCSALAELKWSRSPRRTRSAESYNPARVEDPQGRGHCGWSRDRTTCRGQEARQSVVGKSAATTEVGRRADDLIIRRRATRQSWSEGSSNLPPEIKDWTRQEDRQHRAGTVASVT